MKLFLCFLLLWSSFAQNWEENGQYEYIFGSSSVFSCFEAEDKCAEQNANLVMIKTRDVQDFLETRNWTCT